jgi:hypothetical protein
MARPMMRRWISEAYEGTAYRVSARALHNRGLIRVEGRGPTWTAKITAEGRRLLKEQARRSPLAVTKNSSRTCMAGAPTGRTGTRRGLHEMSLGPPGRSARLGARRSPPSGKARCLLQPVLLYWLRERDA